MSDRVVLVLSEFIPVAEVVDVEMQEDVGEFEYEDVVEVEFEVEQEFDLELDDVDLEEAP